METCHTSGHAFVSLVLNVLHVVKWLMYFSPPEVKNIAVMEMLSVRFNFHCV